MIEISVLIEIYFEENVVINRYKDRWIKILIFKNSFQYCLWFVFLEKIGVEFYNLKKIVFNKLFKEFFKFC